MDEMGSPLIPRNSTFVPRCLSWTDPRVCCTGEGGTRSLNPWKKQQGERKKTQTKQKE